MFDKLLGIETRFETVNEQLCDPATVSDQQLYTKLMKELKQLTPVVEKFREYKGYKDTFEESKMLLDEGGMDKDFKEKGIRKYTYYKKWNGDMNVIFGYSDNAEEIAKKKEIILFEGSKSVFIAHTWGYKNCGALLTSHLSEGQFRFLIGLGVRVVFALDEDVDIRKDKNIQRLKRYCDVEYVYNVGKTLSEKMAPVDAGYDIWKKLYERRRKL